MASELHSTLAERNMLQGEMEYLQGMMAQLARLQTAREAGTSSFVSSRRSSGASFASDYPPSSVGGGAGAPWQAGDAAPWDHLMASHRQPGPPSVGGCGALHQGLSAVAAAGRVRRRLRVGAAVHAHSPGGP